jgi:predicted TIM-barrel fold metal-dependent hydrolase
VGTDLLEFIGKDYVCWASDYPHWDAIFPGAVEELQCNMKGLGEIVQRKILGDNARRFMNLPG